MDARQTGDSPRSVSFDSSSKHEIGAVMRRSGLCGVPAAMPRTNQAKTGSFATPTFVRVCRYQQHGQSRSLGSNSDIKFREERSHNRTCRTGFKARLTLPYDRPR